MCGWFLQPREKIPAPKLLAVSATAFIFTLVLLFTWFGRNWSVFSDLLRAVPHLASRAGGEGHEKSFGYYFQLLDPLFILSFIAAAGVYGAICDAFSNTRKTTLLLVIYGLVIFLIYSFIPYKTPWLALNLWLPLALICGAGVAAFWQEVKYPIAHWGMAVALIIFLAKLMTQTKAMAFDKPADEKNPYAYAHTGEDLLRLPARLNELSQKEHLANPRIAVVAADAWPLPWYLRKFSQVGFWQPNQETDAADFFITSTDVSDQLTERLKNFRPEFFGWRPNVLLILWTPIPAETKP
jgi:predicted membrane-bound mannosyltransferase